uniref:hypothetical protein n=1 Tax=Roseivirga sp. TaxID=1964215 RepID=UPI0040486B9C
MKQVSIFMLTFLLFNSCKKNENKDKVGIPIAIEYEHKIKAEYQLFKPNDTKINAVLILFGGYPEVAEDIIREFQVLQQAKDNSIAIVFSNYSKKLWFEENELNDLADQLELIFTENKLPNDNIVVGGFSSGGDVAFLISNYLIENVKIGLTPERVFIVDSPIDLAELYFSSEKNLERNFSETSINESTWLINELGNRFGNPNEDIREYEKHSVFTLKTGQIHNIENLKNTKIRMYTEPDTLWWKKNRMVDYEQTNAYLIKQLSEKLETSGFSNVEYIPTENRGFRANGEKHPHSWSIVETSELISWILDQ